MEKLAQGSALRLLAALGLLVAPAARAELVRVKIFPHNSKFTTPQGAEGVTSRLRLTAPKGACTLYPAAGPSSADGADHERPLGTGSSFAFDAATVSTPLWLECPETAALAREGMKNPLSYRGSFFVKRVVPAEGAAYLTVVNVLPFEEYLKAVVPAEMDSSWPAEALKAQAVAARTYALFEIAGDEANSDAKIVAEASGAQLDDTVFFQAYQGAGWQTAATDQAVDATKNEAMLYDGKVIKAYFHSDSGGHTEDSAHAFDIPLPYSVAKPEVYAPGSVPGSAWTVQLSYADLTRKLLAAALVPTGSTVTALEIDPKDILPSERPAFVQARLASGIAVRIDARDFRFALGLKSTWIRFSAAKARGAVAIHGKGWGHGAGMSQWGARLMATQLKKTYPEILRFYYTGIELKAVPGSGALAESPPLDGREPAPPPFGFPAPPRAAGAYPLGFPYEGFSGLPGVAGAPWADSFGTPPGRAF
jgi:SpoIID/LytB domain protein